MARIICELPNASLNINGIDFEELPEGGVISKEDLPAEVAEQFAKIPGYKLVLKGAGGKDAETKAKAAAEAKAKADAEAAEKAEAEAAEKEAAEKAAAEAAAGSGEGEQTNAQANTSDAGQQTQPDGKKPSGKSKKDGA